MGDTDTPDDRLRQAIEYIGSYAAVDAKAVAAAALWHLDDQNPKYAAELLMRFVERPKAGS